MPEQTPVSTLWSPVATAVPDWHPKLAEAYAYWKRIHPGDGLPGRRHLDPLDVPSLLPNLWMLDVHRAPFRLRYRLVGTEVAEAMGRDVTGCWFDEVHAGWDPVDPYYCRYCRTAELAQPNWRRGVPFQADVEQCPALENLLLPLASDGRTVDLILAITVFHWTRRG